MSRILFRAYQILCCGLILGLAHCGGGGGGSDFVGAANVTLNLSPSEIDSGDRTELTARISEVNENGIILKFKYPRQISYVTNSAFLEVDGEDLDISPSTNQRKGNDVYLVFFLDEEHFGDRDSGTLTLQLEGNSETSESVIEVDADVDDPLIDDENEFDIDSPEFGAEDSADIEVRN